MKSLSRIPTFLFFCLAVTAPLSAQEEAGETARPAEEQKPAEASEPQDAAGAPTLHTDPQAFLEQLHKSAQTQDDEARNQETAPAETARTALDMATRFITNIRGDVDVQARYLQRLALLLAEEGDWEKAEFFANRIRNYRRQLTLAKLARVALRQDLTEKALELHEDSLQQREGMRENQAVELNKERALTFVELGEIEKARAFTRQFSKSHEYRHLINSAIDRQEVAEGAVPGDDSVLLPADHIELAQRALAQDNGPLATILLKKAHTMLQNYDQWTRLSLLPEIAEGLMEAGEEKMAKLVAAQHTELSLTMTSQLENKVAMMTTSANLYTQLGESPESVNKLLDLADSVKETPGPVWFGHTYGALGKGYYQAGREERAYEIWAQGLERLRENINPRVRAFGSAEIFLAMHSAKAPLKECVKNVADDIGHSL